MKSAVFCGMTIIKVIFEIFVLSLIVWIMSTTEEQSRPETLQTTGSEIVDCGRYISVADINRVHKEKSQLPESSKQLLIKTVDLVAKSEDYIMRNCEIAVVDGDHLNVVFHAGNMGNKYKVHMNDGQEPETIVLQKSWIRDKLGDAVAGFLGRTGII